MGSENAVSTPDKVEKTDKGAKAADVRIDSAFFSDVCRRYAKVGRVLDAAAAIGLGTMNDTFSDVIALVEMLHVMASKGQAYTPDKALNLGSDNAATIATDLLGARKSRSEVRAAIRRIGKPAGK